MKPVRQNVLYSDDGIQNGNCLAACFASLLEIPLWMVPPFDQMFGRGDWNIRIDQWLEVLGYEREWLDGHQVDLLPEFYIATGKSLRGVRHAVVYRCGKLAHDPHYSDAGVIEVDATYHLVKVSS